MTSIPNSPDGAQPADDEGDTVTIRSVCSCGSRLEVTTSPPAAAFEIRALWVTLHDGPGHVRTPPPRA